MTKKKVQLTVQFSCSRVTACQREREQLIGKQKSTLGAAETQFFYPTASLHMHAVAARCVSIAIE
jgi:hypothetical protein